MATTLWTAGSHMARPLISGRQSLALLPCRLTSPTGRLRRLCAGRASQRVRAAQQVAEAPPGLSTAPWTGSPQELKAVEEVANCLKDCPYGSPDAATVEWFLRDRKFNVDDTVQKLTSMLRWRKEFGADDITEASVADELAHGTAYLHQQPDNWDRPVVVVRVAQHVTGARPLESTQRLSVYVVEQALRRLPPGGETILGIFDLRGFTTQNADFGFVRFLVDLFFTYQPKRLGQVLFVDAPWLFQPAWQAIKPLLRKYAALVRFVSREQLAAEYFTPATLPPDFRS